MTKKYSKAFTSRFRHRHLDHFDKLLTETPMLCTLCLESNTPERHGSVLQFEDEDVSVEDAENGNILICKNALCEEQMKKMTIYKDAKKVDRKCDRHKIVWCDIGKHCKFPFTFCSIGTCHLIFLIYNKR